MPKSAKLSKSEKEKLKREEEERKRIEEEEAQLRAKQEERERRKREKEEAVERKRLEKEELKKRVAELDELRVLLEGFRNQSSEFHGERRRQSRWDRYMRCDGSPDPTIPPEINTYLNLWREDNKRVTIEDVLKDSELCLSLIEELTFYLSDTPNEETTTTEAAYNSKTITCLQGLLQEKLDRASHEMLLQASALANRETNNLEAVWTNDCIKLCLWGNLSKNPRIKHFEFEEQGITFDIPRILTLSECAYRILFTKYDHYSLQSKSYSAQLKVPEEPEEEEPPPLEEAEAAPEEEVTGEDGERDDQTPAPVSKDPTMDLMAELNRLDGDEPPEEEEEAAPEPEEEVEPPAEDMCASPVPPEWEDFDGEEDSIDLRASHVIGPVFHFNLLTLPPQPKEANGWTLRRHIDPPALQPLFYVPDDKPGGSTLDLTKEGGSKEGSSLNLSQAGGAGQAPPSTSLGSTLGPGGPVAAGQVAEKRDEKPPITMTFKIPLELYFAEEPQIGRWDADVQEWRTDGIEVVKFSEEERELQFKTSRFGVLAFFQDFHINMPFQSWEMRPLGENSCLLTVVAAINEISLIVKGNQVSVLQNEEKTELHHLGDRGFSVPAIVQTLRNSGINIFPREDSAKYVAVPEKNPIAEERLYEQMAYLSSAMAFSWSRWNTECKDREQIVVQACEHLNEDAVNEDQWNLYTVSRKKVNKLKMKEFAEEFSFELDEDVEFHADFWHTYQSMASEEGKRRVQMVDFHYLDTVHALLKATRPLIFS